MNEIEEDWWSEPELTLPYNIYSCGPLEHVYDSGLFMYFDPFYKEGTCEVTDAYENMHAIEQDCPMLAIHLKNTHHDEGIFCYNCLDLHAQHRVSWDYIWWLE